MSQAGKLAQKYGLRMAQAPMAPLPPLGKVDAPWWDDKPLAIVGTGPSLKGFDFSRFDMPGVRVLAVKESVWDLPFADTVFGLDRPWIVRQEQKLRNCTISKVFAVEPEIRRCPAIEGALYLLRVRRGGKGFSEDVEEIESGGNSGFGAVNYAYLKRARRIVLFGFDYQPGPHYCQERYHTEIGFTGKYATQSTDHNARYWINWGTVFNEVRGQIDRAGVLILNASPTSTVSAFPKVSIEEGLSCLTSEPFSSATTLARA